MDDTPNLGLPYIMAAQAQKHVTHNEAIRRLDAVVQLAVADRDLAAPPGSPADGQRWIVAAGPTGAWAGQAGKVAAWQDGAWAFYSPKEGWAAWVVDEDKLFAWDGSAWVAVVGGAALNPTPLIGINATADPTNRLAVASPASLFNHGGAGHQQKINKAAVGDTASTLYQTNLSGRAEIGLTGDDNFHFKVSSDGSSWKDAIQIDSASGAVSTPFTPVMGDVLIARGAITNQANAVFALPAGYDEIILSVTDWLPSDAGGSQMWLQVSVDGGATWASTGYWWAWRYFRTDGFITNFNAENVAYIQVSGTQVPGGSVAALFRFPSYGATGPKRVRYDTLYGAAQPFNVVDGFGYNDSINSSPITHVRLYPGSGAAGQTQSCNYVLFGRTSQGSTPVVFPPLQRIECTLRNTGGGWFIVNDASHQPIGVSGIAQDSAGITLNFDFTASKICSFIVAPDETYAVNDKLICGASVGATSAYIQIATPTSVGAVNPSTLARATGNLWVSGAALR